MEPHGRKKNMKQERGKRKKKEKETERAAKKMGPRKRKSGLLWDAQDEHRYPLHIPQSERRDNVHRFYTLEYGYG